MKPSTPEAYKLIMEGTQALTQVEHNGIKIDVPYLTKAIEDTQQLIKEKVNQIKTDEVYTMWRRRYGERTNLNSREQLGDIVFNELKVECKAVTKTGKPATGVEALEAVDFPFVKTWVEIQNLTKARSTFLVGLLREVDSSGLVHPVFSTHLASTHRSSSDTPNLQNQPTRDPILGKLIRTSYIPYTDDYVLVEIDYSALEFRGAANFWHDEQMVRYASDPKLDIHRDMGAECYKLDISDVSKTARTFAKNKFVFPTLYGSSYKNCAKNLWNEIKRSEIKSAAGIGLYEHLAAKGIRDFAQYQTHVKEVYDRFEQRFPTWTKKKDIWWKQYLERGWFEMSTGFVCAGVFSYNNLMNTPIQGPSFHLLLWSLTRLQEWLLKYKMMSKIIAEIHDSIFMCVHRKELDVVLPKAKEIMTLDVKKHWPWILTTLGVEVEVGERNWFEKKPVVV